MTTPESRHASENCPACYEMGERAAKHAEVKDEHKDLFWRLLPLSNEEGYQLLADWQAEIEHKARLDEAKWWNERIVELEKGQ